MEMDTDMIRTWTGYGYWSRTLIPDMDKDMGISILNVQYVVTYITIVLLCSIASYI